MNIYEKLQNARIKISRSGIQKSQVNEFTKYKYWGLEDFLPTIMDVCEQEKITPIISTDESGKRFVLSLINSEAPEEKIEFSIPVAPAQMKGMQQIQNLGAMITYSRRYLYMLAFEIVENDVIEESSGRPVQERIFRLNPANSPRNELERLWRLVGYDVNRIDEYLETQSQKRGMPIDDELISAVLSSQMDYLTRESQKINSQFENLRIEKPDD